MKYMYTAEEAAQLRAKLIEDWVKPFAAACFENYSQLQSIMLLLVQPENEFICDAVHDKYIFSSLKNPDLSAAIASEYQLRKDLVNLPEFDKPWEINEIMRIWRSEDRKNKLFHDYKFLWEEDGIVVPAFAGFCKNKSTSKKIKKEYYAPYAILRRQGEDIEVEIIGKMWRPSRDGIPPLFLSDVPEYELRAMAKNSLQGQFYGDYLYSEEESAQLRAQIINYYVKPAIKACFKQYGKLKSATLLIAQYWNDEAHDEVHDRYVFSVLKTPDLEAAFKAHQLDEDRINLPGLNRQTVMKAFWKWQSNSKMCWCSQGAAIPAFAAFCKEGSHQCMEFGEAYSPYAIFRRQGPEIEVEVVGSLLRPWLNGIKPEEYW